MKLSLLVAGALVIISCQQEILSPPQGPGTSYPCGYNGLDCGDGTCCSEGDVCGGSAWSGCPKDMCCFAGPADAVGAHRPRARLKQ